MLEAALSLLSGGLTGLVGPAVQRYADYKTRQLDLQAARERAEHELALREQDARIMAQEWAARVQVSQAEAAGKEAAADAAAFAESLRAEPARWSEGVAPTPGQAWLLVGLDAARGLIRPFLTLYLCGVVTLVYLQARALMAEKGLSPDAATALTTRVVDTVLYLATTCVLWWFGSRNKQNAPKA